MTQGITTREVDWGVFANTRPQARVFWDAMKMPGAPSGGRPWPTVAVAEAGDDVIGIVRGHAAQHRKLDSDVPGAGFAQLEASAADTWMIDGFAVDRDWKGRGVEAHLLDHADTFAKRADRDALSVVVGSFATEVIDAFQRERFTAGEQRTGSYSVGIGVTWVLLTRRVLH